MTRTTFLPSGHLTLSHLKTFARSAELSPPTVLVLSTTTAICRAAHEAPRQNATIIVIKIRLGIVSKSTDQEPGAASYCGNRCFLYIGLGKDQQGTARCGHQIGGAGKLKGNGGYMGEIYLSLRPADRQGLLIQ